MYIFGTNIPKHIIHGNNVIVLEIPHELHKIKYLELPDTVAAVKNTHEINEIINEINELTNKKKESIVRLINTNIIYNILKAFQLIRQLNKSELLRLESYIEGFQNRLINYLKKKYPYKSQPINNPKLIREFQKYSVGGLVRCLPQSRMKNETQQSINELKLRIRNLSDICYLYGDDSVNKNIEKIYNDIKKILKNIKYDFTKRRSCMKLAQIYTDILLEILTDNNLQQIKSNILEPERVFNSV